MKLCALRDDADSPSLVQVYTGIPSLCSFIGSKAMSSLEVNIP